MGRGVGVGVKAGRGQYFRVVADVVPVARGSGKAFASCCGVNLAFSNKGRAAGGAVTGGRREERSRAGARFAGAAATESGSRGLEGAWRSHAPSLPCGEARSHAAVGACLWAETAGPWRVRRAPDYGRRLLRGTRDSALLLRRGAGATMRPFDAPSDARPALRWDEKAAYLPGTCSEHRYSIRGRYAMKVHAGVDLHQRFCYLTAVDARGKLLRQGQVANQAVALQGSSTNRSLSATFTQILLDRCGSFHRRMTDAV